MNEKGSFSRRIALLGGLALSLSLRRDVSAAGWLKAFYRPDDDGYWWPMFRAQAGALNQPEMGVLGGPLDSWDQDMRRDYAISDLDGFRPNALGFYLNVMVAQNNEPKYMSWAGLCPGSARAFIVADQPFLGRPSDRVRYSGQRAMHYTGLYVQELSPEEAVSVLIQEKMPVIMDVGDITQVWQHPAYGVSDDYLYNPDPFILTTDGNKDISRRLSSGSTFWRVPMVIDPETGEYRPKQVTDMTDEEIFNHKGYWLNPTMAWHEYLEYHRDPRLPKPDPKKFNLFLRRLRPLHERLGISWD